MFIIGTGRILRQRTSEIAIQRHSRIFCCRARGRHRDSEDRIGAELAFVRRAVELDHRAIDADLIRRSHTIERRRDPLLDTLHRELDSLAAVTIGVAVTKLDRFMLAGGRSARNRGAAAAPGCRA